MNKKKITPATEIKKILDQIRPQLQMDGGDVEYVSFDKKNGVLKIRLLGHCAHCPMSSMTLQSGIGAAVIGKVKAVKKVIAV